MHSFVTVKKKQKMLKNLMSARTQQEIPNDSLVREIFLSVRLNMMYKNDNYRK